MAKILNDHGWVGNRETPLVLSITIMEDLSDGRLPAVLGAFLIGGSGVAGFAKAFVAIVVVAAVLAVALKVEIT